MIILTCPRCYDTKVEIDEKKLEIDEKKLEKTGKDHFHCEGCGEKFSLKWTSYRSE